MHDGCLARMKKSSPQKLRFPIHIFYDIGADSNFDEKVLVKHIGDSDYGKNHNIV
jgi:hypothetical protein